MGRHRNDALIQMLLTVAGTALSKSRPMSRSWFRQDRRLNERLVFWCSLRPSQQVISQLVTLFFEVEEF